MARVSLKDPDVDFEIATRTRVWLDGVEVTSRCFEADEEKGYVLCYVEDEGGHHVFTDESKSELATEILTGAVKIAMPEAVSD